MIKTHNKIVQKLNKNKHEYKKCKIKAHSKC